MPGTACPDAETEAALLARLRGNDDDDAYHAAVEIVTRYRSVMEVAAWYVLNDWDPAEDVAQEVSLAFMRNYRTAVIHDGLRRYFGQAGRTRALNLVRTEQRVQRRGVHLAVAAVENDGPLYLAVDDLVQEVLQVVAVMPERRRRIFTRVTRDQCTYQDVADELGISLQTVNNNMCQANSDIRRRLAGSAWARAWTPTDLAHVTDTVWTLMETTMETKHA